MSAESAGDEAGAADTTTVPKLRLEPREPDSTAILQAITDLESGMRMLDSHLGQLAHRADKRDQDHDERFSVLTEQLNQCTEMVQVVQIAQQRDAPRTRTTEHIPLQQVPIKANQSAQQLGGSVQMA